jgi:c-di-GMP-related signal transduction protein
MLAEKVETREEFMDAKKAGFVYFQGYFFRKAEIMGAQEIPGSRVNYIKMLQAVSRPELDPREIENAIKGEASLCYRLLRYMNSASFGFAKEMHSVRHALSMLGEREVRRWVRLVATLQRNRTSRAKSRSPPAACPLLRIALSQNQARRDRPVSIGFTLSHGLHPGNSDVRGAGESAD